MPRLTRPLAAAAIATLALAGTAFTYTGAAAAPAAKPSVEARSGLGNGLGRLMAAPGAQRKTAGGLRIDQEKLAIRDAAGRLLIDVTPAANAPASFRAAAERAGLHVTAVDAASGTLEGYADRAGIAAVAALPGTGTVAQSLKPQTAAGKVQSQGVPFQRVDAVQAAGITGAGITVGIISDSFDTATTTVEGDPLADHAADDVASGDLPDGVVVLEDAPDGTDEGRAMAQIVHDVAPGAKLCFATGFQGEVDFANNIRALADKNGPCGADVIVDDLAYFDEPFFSDGMLSDAIDDVAAQGVQYYSSAGNDGDQNGWQSKISLIAAKKGLKGTDLDFSKVDPSLYDGGLQDADPGPGVDVAQTVELGSAGGLFDLQWDDPTDVDGATLGEPFFTAAGELTEAAPERTFSFRATRAQVGEPVEFRIDGVPSGSTDLVLTVAKPDGSTSGPIDTGASPEVYGTTITAAGTYTIGVTGFEGATGPFTVSVKPVLTPSKVSTDFNVLIFDMKGQYLGALADQNLLSGRPAEIAALAGLPKVQLVISRSGTGPSKATTLRALTSGSIFFSEYGDPLTPTVFGHPAAAGATGVAAVDPFRPYLPEFFTSPGGDLPIRYDSDGDAYPTTQVRRSPLIASTDGGNTTFFVSDSTEDADTDPNFFGTSAAAPHAAGIAALVLEQRGGPRSVSPAAMKQLLSSSTFAHDLDPDAASGTSAGLTVSAKGAQGYENDPVPGTLNDPDFFRLSYSGSVPLKSVTFYGESASPTAPGTRLPPLSDGIVFDPRPFAGVTTPASAPDKVFRDSGFPFTVGGTSGGLAASSVTASFAVPGGASKGQYRHMTVTFGAGLKGGQTLRFGVDRDLATSPYGGSNEGNGADELGGAVFIPQRVTDPAGLAFTAVRADGRRIAGVVRNRLGAGYSPVDGYGVIDAEKAVLGR